MLRGKCCHKKSGKMKWSKKNTLIIGTAIIQHKNTKALSGCHGLFYYYRSSKEKWSFSFGHKKKFRQQLIFQAKRHLLINITFSIVPSSKTTRSSFPAHSFFFFHFPVYFYSITPHPCIQTNKKSKKNGFPLMIITCNSSPSLSNKRNFFYEEQHVEPAEKQAFQTGCFHF